VAFFAGGGVFRLAKFAKPAINSLNLSDAEKWRYFVAGIVSAGSGVYLGYRLGTRALPACDDPRILKLLQIPPV
jgi:hypothetical protein